MSMNRQKDRESKRKLLNDWKSDPLLWHRSLFENRLWGRQEDVLLSVRDHKRTAVKSGNTVGKSRISAEIALWFLTTHYPSKVVTTAPGWNQVEEILWKEIANLARRSKIPFGGELLKTQLRFNPEHFAIGISTDEVNRMQGFHSPHMLVILDEALGINSQIWEAMEGLHPYRVLAIGNPLDNTGDFYNCFSSPLWNKMTISCQECVTWQKNNGAVPGLVTQEWIDERDSEWGHSSPLYQARVCGEFPEETESSLFSRRWFDRARDIKIDEDNIEDGPRIIACDVASKHGACETVVLFRYGHTLKNIRGFQRIPTTETRDKLCWLYHDKLPHNLTIDSDGIGEGLGDMLAERRVPYTAFHGGHGQKAIEKLRFKNLRTQFYWIVARKFEKGMYSLSNLADREFEVLKNQFCSIKVKPPDPMGRIQIETKEDLSTRGVRSPDYADCFVYGEYGYWMSRYDQIKPYAYR
jgi:phage terminase large subunit